MNSISTNCDPLSFAMEGFPRLACRAVLLLLCAACAWSGTVYTFESPTYNGSGSGAALAGQDGWFTPGTYSSASVYTYSGLGAPVPTGGGSQFIGLFGPNVQDNHSETFAGSTVWTVTFDILVDSFGSGSRSAGSFFMYANSTGYQLHAFPLQGAGTWNAVFDVFNQNGGQYNGQDPGTGFDGLQMDRWYQEQIVFSTASNQILSVSMEDLKNPSSNTTYNPTGWYLYGGSSAAFSANGIGVYAIGNLGFDNISLQEVASPEPVSWMLWLSGAAALCCLRVRRRFTSAAA
jgi:hypothetical protein